MAGRSDAGLCTVAGADATSSSEPVALKPGHEGDGGRYTDGLRCAQLPSAGPATSHHVCRSCAGNHAAGAPAGQVGRGESPVWQLEEELNHAARGIGEKRESLRQFEYEEASSRLLGLRALLGGPAAAAGRRSPPAAPTGEVARGESERRVSSADAPSAWRPRHSGAGRRPGFRRFLMAFVCVLG